jgi:hypothetical protein
MNTTIVPATPDDNGEPIYELMDITPDLARKWLTENNTHNRNVRPRIVSGYAADMLAGNWVQDGQSIKFSREEVLLDGQHRLTAIAESGVTIRMLVVRNLPGDAQEVMDTGAKRTLGDVLKLRGEKNYVAIASVLMRAVLWQDGARRTIRSTNRPTHRQLLMFLEQHPEIRRSAEIGSRVRNVMRISPGTAGLCHWLFNRIDGSDCAFFFARLTDGAGLVPGDPIYALRRSVENTARDKGRRPEEYVTALVIKAWNAYRDGQELKLIAYRPGGAAPEDYPEPK